MAADSSKQIFVLFYALFQNKGKEIGYQKLTEGMQKYAKRLFGDERYYSLPVPLNKLLKDAISNRELGVNKGYFLNKKLAGVGRFFFIHEKLHEEIDPRLLSVDFLTFMEYEHTDNISGWDPSSALLGIEMAKLPFGQQARILEALTARLRWHEKVSQVLGRPKLSKNLDMCAIKLMSVQSNLKDISCRDYKRYDDLKNDHTINRFSGSYEDLGAAIAECDFATISSFFGGYLNMLHGRKCNQMHKFSAHEQMYVDDAVYSLSGAKKFIDQAYSSFLEQQKNAA